MKVTIHPSKITGKVHAPASKSAMQRACALALIKNGNTFLRNPGKSNDDLAALDVIEKLGAKVIRIDEESILIKSNIQREALDTLNCGESGLGLRMFTPIAALEEKEIFITGNGSLLSRPMDFFDEILPLLDVEVFSNNGKLPIRIMGPLIPKDITIDGSLSSQFLTGLMIAFSAACTSPVTITVENLKSKPYIDLTIHLMDHFGWKVENKDYKQFTFTPVSHPKDFDVIYTVEGDWSGGAFLLVAGAIAGDIQIQGLDNNSTQADKKIIEALNECGADITNQNSIYHIKTGDLKAFEFDATDCPDLFPPLVALATFCNGETIIKGVSRLKHKESDRAATLHSEFGKLGVSINIDGDFMKIIGTKQLKSATVSSHHDHRIAMACAVAALRAGDPVQIEDAEAINKSYPDFYKHMEQLNARIETL